MKKDSPALTLVGGLIAALGASICCSGPFFLLMLGISGSWISSLSAFEPFRPYFIAAVISLFIWAGWQVHRPVNHCAEGSVCAIPANRKRYQIAYWFVVLLAAVLVFSPYWIVWFA